MAATTTTRCSGTAWPPVIRPSSTQIALRVSLRALAVGSVNHEPTGTLKDAIGGFYQQSTHPVAPCDPHPDATFGGFQPFKEVRALCCAATLNPAFF